MADVMESSDTAQAGVDARSADVLRLVRAADSIELKVSVPEATRRSAVAALEMDPLDAQIRQVVFLDTPDLALSEHGVVVRVRRIQGKPGDSVVKLRPVDPDRFPKSLRRSPGFGVEVDAMPSGLVCSASMKQEVDSAKVKAAVAGGAPVRKLFNRAQHRLFTDNAPLGVSFEDLRTLGPINVLKLKFTPRGFGRRFVAELWNYPDGSRVLELSTKCSPAEAFDVAVQTRVFLTEHGIDLSAAQETKTKRALEFFASELRDDAALEAEEIR